MGVLSNLSPKAVFTYFEALCAVPHGSGNTKAISDLCVGFAKELGLRYRQDGLNNVVIWKNASPGYEKAPVVMLQGHMDMVCAKAPDCRKDMAHEGLDVRTDGEWVWADGTTLGGDDGIAVAMILAILADDALAHGPIEAVFTVDEETGMYGAAGLDCTDLQAEMLLNLDSEAEGVFTVGCAGGMRADCRIDANPTDADGDAFTLTLSGLTGGHSGTEIDKGRLSANEGILRVLCAGAEQFPGLRLAAMEGGKVDNAICLQAAATVVVPHSAAADFPSFIAAWQETLQNEFAVTEPGLSLTCAAAAADKALTAADTLRILRCFFALPQGVQAMSRDVPGLVQTSLNMGVLRLDDRGAEASFSIRSGVESQKQWLLHKLTAILALSGGTVTTHGDYPGWQFRRQSPLRDALTAAYRQQTGREPVIETIHAGLECGLFIGKLPRLDAVSIGPDLRHIHTCQERLGVASVARLYDLVCRTLEGLK